MSHNCTIKILKNLWDFIPQHATPMFMNISSQTLIILLYLPGTPMH